MEHMRRVWLSNIGRHVLWTPGPVSLGTIIYSTCLDLYFTNLTCFPDFELRISLGTFILVRTSSYDHTTALLTLYFQFRVIVMIFRI